MIHYPPLPTCARAVAAEYRFTTVKHHVPMFNVTCDQEPAVAMTIVRYYLYLPVTQNGVKGFWWWRVNNGWITKGKKIIDRDNYDVLGANPPKLLRRFINGR